MQLVSDLRRCAAESPDGALEYEQDDHRLTVTPIADMADVLAFTVWEVSFQEWNPVLAGQITESDDLAISHCASSAAVGDFDLLTSALLGVRPSRHLVTAGASRPTEEQPTGDRVLAQRWTPS